MQTIQQIGHFGYLLWEVLRNLPYAFRDRKRVLYQLDHVGVNSIPLVILVGFFVGAIMAWQAAYQMKGMVSLTILGGQVTKVIIMEMGPALTALVISGRIGASMTAEIGSMKITEQIDALRTMSLDPIRFIVMPRFIGLVVMLPILTVFSMTTAILGAYLVSHLFLSVTPHIFFDSVKNFFYINDLMGGLAKSFVFGMMIALIGCYKGLNATGGAEGVGRATITSFVIAAVSILIGDFMLWLIFF